MKLTVEGDPEEISAFFERMAPGEDARDSLEDTCRIRWNSKEDASIEHAKDWYEAVEMYRAAFPKSKRNRNAIRKHFWEMNEKKKKPAQKVPEDPDDLLLGACRDCDNGKDGKKFDTQQCDKCSPPPSPVAVPAEIPPAPIAKKLKEKFNPSTASERKPEQVKKRGKYKKKADHQIPFESTGDDRAPYQRAMRLCKKYGLPYPEALAKDMVKHPEKYEEKPAPAVKAQKKVRVKKPKLPHRMKNREEPEKVSAKTTPAAPTNSATTLLDPLKIVTGVHVRQTRPDGGRQIFGTGTVIARHGEIIDVRNGGGKVHKILAACLEVVTSTHQGEEKAAGEAA